MLAGRYHNKQGFIHATFGRLDGVLHGGVKLEVGHLYSQGRAGNVETVERNVLHVVGLLVPFQYAEGLAGSSTNTSIGSEWLIT